MSSESPPTKRQRLGTVRSDRGLSGSPSPRPAPPLALPACRLRIVHINDVYVLDNMPRFKTLVDEQRKKEPNLLVSGFRRALDLL